MRILGIETSCDETAAAIVEDGVKILSNVTATSAGIHARTGGVIPEDAARKQIQAIIPIIDLALKESKTSSAQIDAIAITYGPGLIGSLLVGVETAKTLSLMWNKPLVPVNHLVGHIYANWVSSSSIPKLPTMALVVSGGHTDLVIIEDHGKIKWISGTRDDAAGEAFDKTARLLGLPYPGGPNISKIADKYRGEYPKEKLDLFPRPMIHEDNFDWSFSGLKTAVLTEVKNLSGNNKPGVRLSEYESLSKNIKVIQKSPKIAAEIQEAIVDVLIDKTLRAARQYKIETLLLAGGVAANKRLREKLASEIKAERDNLTFHVPEAKLCTDNAATIASCAFFNFKPIEWKELDANPSLTITS